MQSQGSEWLWWSCTRDNGGAGGDSWVCGMSLTGAAPGSGCACLLQGSLCLSCSSSL